MIIWRVQRGAHLDVGVVGVGMAKFPWSGMF